MIVDTAREFNWMFCKDSYKKDIYLHTKKLLEDKKYCYIYAFPNNRQYR